MSATEVSDGGGVAVGGNATDPSLVRSKRWARAEIQKAVEVGSSRAKWYKADPSLVRSKTRREGQCHGGDREGGGPGGLRKQAAVGQSGQGRSGAAEIKRWERAEIKKAVEEGSSRATW